MIGDETFYHGTGADAAYSMMTAGFQVGEEKNGRGMGQGLYITRELRFVPNWGELVIACRLVRGTRILWQRPPDRRVLDALRAEFGAAILTLDFPKALPNNKKLTRREVANLFHHLHAEQARRWARKRPKDPEHWYERLGRIYSQLRLHGYEGVGSRDPEWPEVLVFNPSSVVPISAHTCTADHRDSGSLWLRRRVDLSAPLALGELELLRDGGIASDL